MTLETTHDIGARPSIGLGNQGQSGCSARQPDYAALVPGSPERGDALFNETAVFSRYENDLLISLAAKRRYLVQKRLMDIVLSAAGLLVLAVPMLFIALAVAVTSRGWPVFHQTRHGKDNRPITVFKFATIHSTASDRTGLKQVVFDDPRVTALGRLLRKTSLDELPQLWNVLRGDMSLVGPRAHPIGMLGGDVPYEELCPLYPLRHSMRPGITGLAQVNGCRGHTGDPSLARMRVAYDLAYVETASLATDAKILLETLFVELPKCSGY